MDSSQVDSAASSSSLSLSKSGPSAAPADTNATERDGNGSAKAQEADELGKELDAAASSGLQAKAAQEKKYDDFQVALITGSASGIGRGTARAFSALNYRLALVDKCADRLAETSSECFECSPQKLKPLELAVDLAADGQQVAREIVERILKEFGRLDVLVNNAGIISSTKFDDPKCLDVYHRIIATNMHSVVYLCLAAFEPLKESGGSIVNVSSVCDRKPGKYKFAYCMSKAAITMLTKCLANDLAPHVRVNCVSPGPIASSILDDMGISLNTRETNALRTTLVQRIGKPEEVAKMITFLASKDKAAFITGSRVLVDGGYTIKPSGID